MLERTFQNYVWYSRLEDAIVKTAKEFKWNAYIKQEYTNERYGEMRYNEPGLKHAPKSLGISIRLGRFKRFPAMSIFLPNGGLVRKLLVESMPPCGFTSERKANRYLDAVYRRLGTTPASN